MNSNSNNELNNSQYLNELPDDDSSQESYTDDSEISQRRYGLRACLNCLILKTSREFQCEGCNNCEYILHLQNNPQKVMGCTTSNYSLADNPTEDELDNRRWSPLVEFEDYYGGTYAHDTTSSISSEFIEEIENHIEELGITHSYPEPQEPAFGSNYNAYYPPQFSGYNYNSFPSPPSGQYNFMVNTMIPMPASTTYPLLNRPTSNILPPQFTPFALANDPVSDLPLPSFSVLSPYSYPFQPTSNPAPYDNLYPVPTNFVSQMQSVPALPICPNLHYGGTDDCDHYGDVASAYPVDWNHPEYFSYNQDQDFPPDNFEEESQRNLDLEEVNFYKPDEVSIDEYIGTKNPKIKQVSPRHYINTYNIRYQNYADFSTDFHYQNQMVNPTNVQYQTQPDTSTDVQYQNHLISSTNVPYENPSNTYTNIQYQNQSDTFTRVQYQNQLISPTNIPYQNLPIAFTNVQYQNQPGAFETAQYQNPPEAFNAAQYLNHSEAFNTPQYQTHAEAFDTAQYLNLPEAFNIQNSPVGSPNVHYYNQPELSVNLQYHNPVMISTDVQYQNQPEVIPYVQYHNQPQNHTYGQLQITSTSQNHQNVGDSSTNINSERELRISMHKNNSSNEEKNNARNKNNDVRKNVAKDKKVVESDRNNLADNKQKDKGHTKNVTSDKKNALAEGKNIEDDKNNVVNDKKNAGGEQKRVVSEKKKFRGDRKNVVGDKTVADDKKNAGDNSKNVASPKKKGTVVDNKNVANKNKKKGNSSTEIDSGANKKNKNIRNKKNATGDKKNNFGKKNVAPEKQSFNVLEIVENMKKHGIEFGSNYQQEDLARAIRPLRARGSRDELLMHHLLKIPGPPKDNDPAAETGTNKILIIDSFSEDEMEETRLMVNTVLQTVLDSSDDDDFVIVNNPESTPAANEISAEVWHDWLGGQSDIQFGDFDFSDSFQNNGYTVEDSPEGNDASESHTEVSGSYSRW